MKRCLVLGSGGFIGWHLAKRLHEEGNFVAGVDLKFPEFDPFIGNHFQIADLRDKDTVRDVMNAQYDEVYQLAADMGGAGFVFTGEHDEQILANNAQININVAGYAHFAERVFFSSSACVYPPYCQFRDDFEEQKAYPAFPDSPYGWEKLFSEIIYQHVKEGDIRIARFHNVYGPNGAYQGGREKSPAAICRKIAEAKDGGEIEIWGDGQQIRSYLYIDDCIDGILAVMRSDHKVPFNVGSERGVTITDLANIVRWISGKSLTYKYVDGPKGVNRRVSNNGRIRSLLGWEPKVLLEDGLHKTYQWIEHMVNLQSGMIQENMK